MIWLSSPLSVATVRLQSGIARLAQLDANYKVKTGRSPQRWLPPSHIFNEPLSWFPSTSQARAS